MCDFSDFDELAKTGNIFVDNTMLIPTFMNGPKKVCVLAPRRWCKTCNLTMTKVIIL